MKLVHVLTQLLKLVYKLTEILTYLVENEHDCILKNSNIVKSLNNRHARIFVLQRIWFTLEYFLRVRYGVWMPGCWDSLNKHNEIL